MFSTLSTLLPSSLQPSTPIATGEQSAANQYETDDDDDGKSVISEVGAIDTGTGKKKKGKGPHETFIIVRPPPAKSNHPLNLQVQLVPPGGKASVSVSAVTGDSPGSRRTSIDSNASSSEQRPISRSNSISSNYNPSDSTASINSTSTTASTISTRRTIVPLYNLQAHNVMTNVVVDAGTDAKIAKFQRRGLEMIDLGILECVELWPTPNKDNAPRASVDVKRTPASSAVSLSSAGHSHIEPPEINITPIPESTTLSPIPGTPAENEASPAQPKKNLFGKLFSRKEKDKSSPPSSLAPEDRTRSPSPSPGHLRTGSSTGKEESMWRRHSKNLSFSSSPSPATTRHSRPASFIETSPSEFGVASHERSASPSLKSSVSRRNSVDLSHNGPPTVTATAEAQIRPAVLGLQPTLSGVYSPKSRVQLYIWTMRKWIKGSDSSILSSLLSGAFSGRESGFKEGGSNLTAREGDSSDKSGKVELRLEWRKSLKAKKKKKKAGEGEERKARKSIGGDRDDAGDESDPEDSETPWVCTLKIRRAHIPSNTLDNGLSPTPSRLSANPPSVSSATGKAINKRLSIASLEASDLGHGQKEKESRTLRVKVATLSPTPHHPKVVGMLKVPFPLCDVDFSPALPGGVVVRKRLQGQKPEPFVSTDDSSGLPKGFTLTAEEIKDVVSVSGLWLVVREGFGGVGKERRKGDGWKLRG
ncbi:hypothetical protein DL96DRAFT_303408 [Flagelloscypha sp. PMI_526]|nr:hypothetical protein DL96DRAFT_303408 [Flagelloscypha sp. PMI_526]